MKRLTKTMNCQKTIKKPPKTHLPKEYKLSANGSNDRRAATAAAVQSAELRWLKVVNLLLTQTTVENLLSSIPAAHSKPTFAGAVLFSIVFLF